MRKAVAFILAIVALFGVAYAIAPTDVSRHSVTVDGHLGNNMAWPGNPGFPIWPLQDIVDVRGQVDNLTAAPTGFRVTLNGNDLDYGDFYTWQVDSDSWAVELVIIPLNLGHYEFYVSNSSGEAMVTDFWCAFT